MANYKSMCVSQTWDLTFLFQTKMCLALGMQTKPFAVALRLLH